jgi:hypothetical protein
MSDSIHPPCLLPIRLILSANLLQHIILRINTVVGTGHANSMMDASQKHRELKTKEFIDVNYRRESLNHHI